ncbi:serine/threonine dehydratase [Brevibacterium luteolum]|uniref:serine/threonine dehydratase n=1 Tax=Brevibacterium luteolum TaxID=199591 RepID=UPI0021AE56D8|nr:serine/threonine dehydratase [Brevibacterium luteolum]MCT1830385.1 serine/threonine dehydratase [Brevibacterium luteolum]
MSIVPTRDEITVAHSLISSRIRCTPLLDITLPDGTPVTLKLELFQHTGSFKPRGAFTGALTAAEPPKTLVAASGGNHGLAVAHVASELGIPARIFVPSTTPKAKVSRLAAMGAEVTVTGDVYADAFAASQEAAAQPNAMALHAYDSPATVTGQGTLGAELDAQLRSRVGEQRRTAAEAEAPTVLVATGGGGLVGGISAWFGSSARVVPVEPETCAALHTALQNGKRTPISPSGVAADSLGASTVGEICFAVACRNALQPVLVADAAIRQARRWLWRRTRIAAEPGGAAALAALLSGAYQPTPGELVTVVVCGANADPSDLPLD